MPDALSGILAKKPVNSLTVYYEHFKRLLQYMSYEHYMTAMNVFVSFLNLFFLILPRTSGIYLMQTMIHTFWHGSQFAA